MDVKLTIDASDRLLEAIKMIGNCLSGLSSFSSASQQIAKPLTEEVKVLETTHTATAPDLLRNAVAEQGASQTAQTDQVLNIEQLRAAVSAKAKAHKDAVKAIIAATGATNVSTIPADKYLEVITALNQLA